MKSYQIILLFGVILVAACSKRAVSYESRFLDEISIEFPSGHPESEVAAIKKHIDETLRASNAGFFSGAMLGGDDIDFISIDTDFDLVDEHSLVAGFIQDGTIPKDVKAKYKRGKRP